MALETTAVYTAALYRFENNLSLSANNCSLGVDSMNVFTDIGFPRLSVNIFIHFATLISTVKCIISAVLSEII